MLVQRSQEMNSFYVFLSAVTVRYPLTLPAAIVKVEHRGNGIDPKAVHVVLVEPEQGIANEKGLDFVTTVVEYEGIPVRVLALARIRMLIKVGPIEESEPSLVLGIMCWYPIENDSDPSLMKNV